MYCPSCGKELPKNKTSRACLHCRAVISAAIEGYAYKVLFCDHCDAWSPAEVRSHLNELKPDEFDYMPSGADKSPWISYGYHCSLCAEYLTSCSKEDQEEFGLWLHSHPHIYVYLPHSGRNKIGAET